MAEKEGFDPGDLVQGTLNIFGVRIDLSQLLESPEDVKSQLEQLRERLKAAGGKEVLSDEEWGAGAVRVGGYIRTRGPFGQREYHVGTGATEESQGSSEVVEPPVDVFDEGEEIVVIADVPGVGTNDVEIHLEGRRLILSTRATARRRYRKELDLDSDVDGDSQRATCNNGVLEVRLHKRQGA